MLVRTDFARHALCGQKPVSFSWALSIHASLEAGLVKVEEPLGWHLCETANAKWEYATLKSCMKGIEIRSKLQRTPNWQNFYQYIKDNTSENHFPTAHHMAALMLKRGIPALLSLCKLCCSNHNKIFSHPQKGWKGKANALLYPLSSFAANGFFALADESKPQ